MYTQRQSIARPRQASGNSTRTLVFSFFGLLPVGLVSGLMLMDILGVWTY